MPIRGDVGHSLYRHLGDSLLYFSLWGLLGAPKCDASKIEREGVPWPYMAAVSTINTTTNQKLVLLVGIIFRRAVTCGRGVIPSIGAANQAT